MSLSQIIIMLSSITAITASLCAICIFVYFSMMEREWDKPTICGIIAVICYAISATLEAIYFLYTNDAFASYAYTIDGILWRLGTATVYVMFIKRFQRTFGDTKYDISNTLYKLMYILCILFVLLGVILNLYIFHGQSLFLVFLIVLNTFSQVIDLTLSILLIGLFIYKLFLLNVDIGSNYFDQNEMSNNTSLHYKQVSILNAISKITVLSIMAVVTTQIVFLLEAIRFTDKLQANYNAAKEMYGIEEILYVIDILINSLCVIGSFDFMDPYYRYTPCATIDLCCNRVCRYITRKKQSRGMIELKETLLLNHA
eukprot:222268_1